MAIRRVFLPWNSSGGCYHASTADRGPTDRRGTQTPSTRGSPLDEQSQSYIQACSVLYASKGRLVVVGFSREQGEMSKQHRAGFGRWGRTSERGMLVD